MFIVFYSLIKLSEPFTHSPTCTAYMIHKYTHTHTAFPIRTKWTAQIIILSDPINFCMIQSTHLSYAHGTTNCQAQALRSISPFSPIWNIAKTCLSTWKSIKPAKPIYVLKSKIARVIIKISFKKKLQTKIKK